MKAMVAKAVSEQRKERLSVVMDQATSANGAAD